MIVLVETNFVLELAFQQEESEEAARIVDLAEKGEIRLVVPACALAEPYETLVRRRKERSEALVKMQEQINQVSRSRAFREFAQTSRVVTESLARSSEIESQGLDDTIRRLMASASVPSLSKEILARALEAQRDFSFDPQDAVVFASVEEHLRTAEGGPRLFVNKNHSDFLKPEIEEHLQANFGCKLIPNFSNARQYIEYETRRARN